ncbi:hypothetical protein [Flavobacterium johnsoniae]|nr:hypothetical protein [Flavobacterium johnsoniae]WQG82431.1 hypothetical protein SR927_04785 [Flavobacterium johnsoniae UW101]SHM01077.1 hypothetical protein SAMN05444146_5168 [Flavobacterium johnsoniae]
MSKVKIKLIILGQLPVDLDKLKLSNWKSEVFEIVGQIDNYSIVNNADGLSWEFSDENIEEQLPENYDGDFLIAMTHVPLENNYYARRFANNRICMTFYEMADILNINNIPIENLVYRLLYSYTLIYKRHGNRMPSRDEITSFTHDETRGCLFDMNGIKSDVVYSTNNPIICDQCVQKLTAEKVPLNIISEIKEELKSVKKGIYYRLADLIKKYPVWAILLSTISAFIIGTLGSLIATIIWEKLI